MPPLLCNLSDANKVQPRSNTNYPAASYLPARVMRAAAAALSDRSALREYVEADPALEGLDRLYVQEVVDAMLRMHSDILTQFTSDDEEE